MRIEAVGENTCARWHRDQFVGRAIVTYTGAAGTEFTSRDNVDFKELMYNGTRLGRREPHSSVPAVAHPTSPPSPYIGAAARASTAFTTSRRRSRPHPATCCC